jgi:hypothetical protein
MYVTGTSSYPDTAGPRSRTPGSSWSRPAASSTSTSRAQGLRRERPARAPSSTTRPRTRSSHHLSPRGRPVSTSPPRSGRRCRPGNARASRRPTTPSVPGRLRRGCARGAPLGLKRKPPALGGRLPIQVRPNRDGQGYVPERAWFEWLGRREAPMSAASPEPMCGSGFRQAIPDPRRIMHPGQSPDNRTFVQSGATLSEFAELGRHLPARRRNLSTKTCSTFACQGKKFAYKVRSGWGGGQFRVPASAGA